MKRGQSAYTVVIPECVLPTNLVQGKTCRKSMSTSEVYTCIIVLASYRRVPVLVFVYTGTADLRSAGNNLWSVSVHR